MTNVDLINNLKLRDATRDRLLSDKKENWRVVVPSNHFGRCQHCDLEVGKYGLGGLYRNAHGAEAMTASYVAVCDECIVQVYAVPAVGMAVTQQVGSDLYAGTIVRVSESGKTFWFTKDKTLRLGLREPNPGGEQIQARRDSKGIFRTSGTYRMRIYLGIRETRLDPHF